MSTEPLIRELFRNLESNLHERLVMIEQILQAVEKPKVPLYDNEFVGRIEALERQQRRPVVVEDLNARFVALEEMMTKMYVEIESMKRQRAEPVVSPVVVAPAPASKKVVAPPQWEEEEPEVEPEVEEQEELELEEFEYKGRTFFKDQNNMVYAADEEGEISTDEPIGQWNGKRIIAVPS